MRKPTTRHLTLSALCLALGLVLPLFFGQNRQLGNMFAPMHLPALLTGFIVPWPYALATGFIMPLTRTLFFGMPPLVPTAIAMAFELGAYALVTALAYNHFPKRPPYLYLSLAIAMVIGRIAWALARYCLFLIIGGNPFTLAIFWTEGFAVALPGICVQLLLIPFIVLSLKKAGFTKEV